MGTMKLTILGARGFIPVPGPGTTRHGGNTATVYIEGPEGEHLLLDAGSGLFPLGRSLLSTPFGRGQGELHMVISHSHFDHLMGFPFFIPVYIPGNVMHIYGASSSAVRLKDALEGQLNPHFSPIQRLENMGSTIQIHSVTHGQSLDVGALTVSFFVVPHGKTESLVTKVTAGDSIVVYAPVVGDLSDEQRAALVEFVRGASVLIHDSSYPEHNEECERYGVSTPDRALALAEDAGVRELRLYHFAPDLTDDDIDSMAELAASRATSVVVLPAREGETLIV